jgi:hypothetical protein
VFELSSLIGEADEHEEVQGADMRQRLADLLTLGKSSITDEKPSFF